MRYTTPNRAPETTPTDLYASWDRGTVTFLMGTGEVIDNQELGYGDSITYPSDLAMEGHAFTGWDNDITMMPGYDLTITALWSVSNYTVSFDLGNGTVIEEIVPYNRVIEYPKDVDREGYIFNQWDKNVTFMPAENITITALWTEATTFVEIVFSAKDMSEAKAKAIIEKYTKDDFVIEKFEADKETGNMVAIVRFTDKDETKKFYQRVQENNRDGIRLIVRKDFSSSYSATSLPSFFCVVLSSLF